MKDTLVLLTEKASHGAMRRRILNLGENSNDGHFTYVHLHEGTVGIVEGDHLIDEYEPEELAVVKSRVGEITPTLVEYPDERCARALLAECLSGLVGILDTNYGELLDYSEVLHRMTLDPSWSPRSHN